MNGIPLINGVEYSWGDIAVTAGGVPLAGITKIDYEDSQEKENIYGAGRYPVARGHGRISCSGKITLLEKEVRALQAAAPDGRLQSIVPFDIIVSYIPINGNKIIHDKLIGCEFKKNSRSWAEGDMSKEVELELVVGRIDWGR